MFYSVIAELPFFEQFNNINKQKLIKDLEDENNDSPVEMGHNDDYKPYVKPESKCKC